MDDRRLAGNFGFGFQKATCEGSNLFRRIYFFLISEDTPFRLYKQISAGFEWFGEYFNLSFNGYLPLNQKGHKRLKQFQLTDRFHLKHESNDYAMRGFDVNASDLSISIPG